MSAYYTSSQFFGWFKLHILKIKKNDICKIKLHLRFHQNEAKLQQESLGIMGVNLIYGAFYKHNEPLKLMKYLTDHIDDQSIEIDTINFSGPLFKGVDNRLISLELVRLGMTDAVIFDENGTNVLPAQVLYKKNILTLRGSYRPITKVNEEMFKKSLEAFLKEKKVKEVKVEAPKLDAVIRRDGSTTINNNATSRRYKS